HHLRHHALLRVKGAGEGVDAQPRSQQHQVEGPRRGSIHRLGRGGRGGARIRAWHIDDPNGVGLPPTVDASAGATGQRDSRSQNALTAATKGSASPAAGNQPRSTCAPAPPVTSARATGESDVFTTTRTSPWSSTSTPSGAESSNTTPGPGPYSPRRSSRRSRSARR